MVMDPGLALSAVRISLAGDHDKGESVIQRRFQAGHDFLSAPCTAMYSRARFCLEGRARYTARKVVGCVGCFFVAGGTMVMAHEHISWQDQVFIRWLVDRAGGVCVYICIIRRTEGGEDPTVHCRGEHLGSGSALGLL